MELTAAQTDRACGALLASAVGDALGAGYEFGAARYCGWPAMIGGGLGDFEPGGWTDDTAQAAAIAVVAASGADLRTTEARDAVAANFAAWYAGGPADVGIQTGAVLSAAGRDSNAARMTEAARRFHLRSGRSAGNGSLMRTAPVALAYLDDPAGLVDAAMGISALTHHEDLAGEAAALWCLLIRHAVLTGQFPDFSDEGEEWEGFELLAPRASSGTDWHEILAETEIAAILDTGTFRDGWAVGALQAAWSAITCGTRPGAFPCRHLQNALASAVGSGHDTDTVAAIAGALLGARWGVSAVPQEWAGAVHGWGPNGRLDGRDLVRLALLTVQGGPAPSESAWPVCDRMDYRGWEGAEAFVAHPVVDDVWIGGALALDSLPAEIDAVVSLCRVGRKQVPEGVAHHVVRLIDTVPEDNPNLAFAIDDAARTVLNLRAQGKRVYLHCVAGHSRTPTVAAWLGVLAGAPLHEALSAVMRVLPAAQPQSFLLDELQRLEDLMFADMPDLCDHFDVDSLEELNDDVLGAVIETQVRIFYERGEGWMVCMHGLGFVLEFPMTIQHFWQEIHDQELIVNSED